MPVPDLEDLVQLVLLGIAASWRAAAATLHSVFFFFYNMHWKKSTEKIHFTWDILALFCKQIKE